jgi:4-hydroxy-tetrahydrodipicolinate synthase
MPVQLAGVWVPLVTPLRDGRVDLDSLRRLAAHLAEQGVDGFVACGTTGEAALLGEDERAQVIGAVCDLDGPPVLAGSGASSTAATIERTVAAAGLGADGALVLSPGLVAPSQEELRRHYLAVAEASPIPLVVYNFPARTGAGVAAATTLALARHPAIVGTKQSLPALDDELQRTILEAPEGFAVVVGGARLLWPALALGATGGILAAAHLEAPALLRVAALAAAGDAKAAAAAHRELWPRLAGGGIATIKRRLHEAGLLASPELRAPLG